MILILSILFTHTSATHTLVSRHTCFVKKPNGCGTSLRHDPLAYTTTDRHLVPPVWRAKLLLERRGRVLEGLPFEFPCQPVGARGPVRVSNVCEEQSVETMARKGTTYGKSPIPLTFQIPKAIVAICSPMYANLTGHSLV